MILNSFCLQFVLIYFQMRLKLAMVEDQITMKVKKLKSYN